MDKDFESDIQDAILFDDIAFLERNKDKYGINHRFVDEDNATLLMYSIRDKYNICYKYFIERGADQSLLDDEGLNIVQYAIFSGILDRVKYVLNSDNINHQSNDGTTPLHLSICLEKYDIVNYLIDRGADIHITDHGESAAIHMASYFGNIDLVTRLVERGASFDKETKQGNLPIVLAVNERHTEVVKFLYKKMYG
ncbi:MAG: ankyrin repeat domain-containing protein [Hyphomicrobiales bacterium]